MSKESLKYKLIAFDVDGTLVPEHTHDLSPGVIAAIKAAKEVVTVAIVSARARADQQVIIDALELHNLYHVTENGTRVIKPDGDLEYTLYLPSAAVRQMRDAVESLCESIGYCIDGKWLQVHPESTDDIVTTLSFISPKNNGAKIFELLKALPDQYAITLASHWSDPNLSLVLLSHKDAAKGGGLRYLQKVLGITPEETIAVGDGASDVSMMEYAAVKVAMGNAEEVLKNVATHVVASVQDDGVVEVINRFVLNTES